MKVHVLVTPPGDLPIDGFLKIHPNADLIIWFLEKEVLLRTTGEWVPWVKGQSIKQSLGEE